MNKTSELTNALLLQTLLCFSLLAFRYAYTGWDVINWASPHAVVYSRGITFLFLVWNLILAWVPYWLAGRLKAQPLKYGLPILLLWLLFFPNAPYLITDLMHLRSRPPVPVWYDGLLIFAFAWTGLLLGVLSLHRAQIWIKEQFGSQPSRIFVAGAFLLCGFGLYLGRFLRWNSWDLFTRPAKLLGSVADTILQSWHQPTVLIVTFGFALLMGGCYWTLLSLADNFSTSKPNHDD